MTVLLAKRILAVMLYLGMLLLDAFCHGHGHSTPGSSSERTSYNASALEYHKIDGVEIDWGGVTVPYDNSPVDYFYIHFRTTHSKIYRFDDIGADKAVYDSLRIARNDTTCPTEIIIYRANEQAPKEYDYIPDRANIAFPAITNIDVVCNTDFDPEHPAGTSLSNYTTINYIHKNPIPNTDQRCGITVGDIKINELADQNLHLESYPNKKHEHGVLKVRKLPADRSRDHSLTVSITTADGKTYSAQKTIPAMYW